MGNDNRCPNFINEPFLKTFYRKRKKKQLTFLRVFNIFHKNGIKTFQK